MRQSFIMLGISCATSVSLLATDWSETPDDSLWNNNANWTLPPFPNNGGEAIFGISTIKTVTVNQDITINRMEINEPGYIFGGESTLTLDRLVGGDGIANNVDGTMITCPIHTISTNISGTPIIYGNGELTIAGSISGGGLIVSNTLFLTENAPVTVTTIRTEAGGTLILNRPTPDYESNTKYGTVSGTIATLAENQFSDGNLIEVIHNFNTNGFSQKFKNLEMLGGNVIGGGTLSLLDPDIALRSFKGTITASIALINGGSVLLGGNNSTNIINGNFDLGNSVNPINFDVFLNNSLEIQGSITGTGEGLTKTGSGTLTFTGASANTYEGLTTVSEGNLLLNKTTGPAIPGNLLINGGTLTLATADQISDASIVTLTSGTFDRGGFSDTIGTLNFQGGTFLQGLNALNLNNADIALVMGNTTLSGDINILNGGSVVFDSTNGGISLINGNLDLGNLSLVNFDTANGPDPIDMNISGIISGTGEGLTKIGAGALTFTGASANTYAGLTTVSEGNLLLNKTTGPAIPGNILINGGTLILGASNQISDTTVLTMTSGSFDGNGFSDTLATLNLYGGTFLSEVGTLTLTDPLTALSMGNTTLSENVTLQNGGSIVFDNTNNGTAIINGNLDLGAIPINFNIADGTSEIDMLVNGIITNGGIVKQGTGALSLTGTNTYSGNTLVSNGTLIGNTTSLPGNIENNANLIFDQASDGTYSAILSGSGNFVKQGAAALTLTGANTFAGNTLVSNGTLIGNTASLPGNIENNANLIFDQTSDGTYSAILSGSGNFVKQGAAALTLTGANTYSGNTLVSNGTLIGNTASLPGNIENNANLIFDQTSDGTYSAILSGSGNFVKQGAAALTLTGVNTYSGNTLISNGTLIGNTASLPGSIENNANLIFDQSFDGTYNAILSGSGNFVKQGAAALTLTGANTYLGNTLVSNGTLIGNTASLPGNIENNANLIFDQFFDGTYNAMLSGSGNFVKQGAGNLILSNNNLQSGNVIINEGVLTVNGSFGAGSSMIVNSGATLKGTGTITKDVTLYGTLAPGNSIGTIHLVGDQIFASGSTLEIEFNASQGDLVDIIGSLDIQPGTTLQLIPEMDLYPNNFTYNFIETTGGVTGTFSTIANSLPAFQFAIDYGTLDVALTLVSASVIPFSDLVDNKNALAVANCLDQVPLADNDINFVIANLRMLPTTELIEEALLQMQPSAFTSLAVVQENATIYVKNAIYNHLESGYRSCNICQNDNMSLWISPYIATTSQDSKSQEPGFSADTGGIIGGADFSLQKQSSFGLGIGFNHSNLEWSYKRGHADINSGFVSLYGKVKGAYGYLVSSLMGSYNKYTTKRNIKFGSINRHAKADHSGLEGSFHLKGALNFDRFSTKISPFGSIDYIYEHEKSFKESGADRLNLNVDSKSSNLLIAEAGINISHCFRPNFIPFVQLGVIQESRFNGRRENASLQDGCAMEVKGRYPSRTLAGVSAGINTQICDTTVSLLYQGKYGAGFTDNALFLQFEKNF